MTDEYGPKDSSGAAGVDIGNIANHPYLENNPYQDLDNNEDDDDKNTADHTDIEIVAAPAEISEIIFDVDEESTGVEDRETTGVTSQHTGVATSDNKEITGVTDTEADDMVAIDATI